jgi:hypothetical protein
LFIGPARNVESKSSITRNPGSELSPDRRSIFEQEKRFLQSIIFQWSPGSSSIVRGFATRKPTKGPRYAGCFDTLIIVVKSPTLDVGAAGRYRRRHRELMTGLKEVIGRVLREKPPDSLTLMRDLSRG